LKIHKQPEALRAVIRVSDLRGHAGGV